ncbi:ImmA/IrrE family metallo-endopeptidase [bacterium]|nr:ImmA/IrrE family metallo-endopeptidase [candidate division CSSED10-310 bacterium]
MNNRQIAAREGLRGALEVRKMLNLGYSQFVCVFDAAERLGLEVRFLGGSSFEGMYSRSKQTILVPSLRPQGRQAFACSHELGHWYFGHGSKLEDLESLELGNSLDQEDHIANVFAGYFLATPWAVKAAFQIRKWEIQNCTPVQIFSISNQFGMGYQSLIRHMQYSVQLISRAKAEELLKWTPQKIRFEIFGSQSDGHLVIADLAWRDIAIDLRVGDSAIVPHGSKLDKEILTVVNEFPNGIRMVAREPGITRISCEPNWSSYIRISKMGFEGRSVYRHLEDCDED